MFYILRYIILAYSEFSVPDIPSSSPDILNLVYYITIVFICNASVHTNLVHMY